MNNIFESNFTTKKDSNKSTFTPSIKESSIPKRITLGTSVKTAKRIIKK